jgi:methylglutaconyl-CoA hydratase
MEKFDTITFEKENYICTLWLARPEKRNAINRQMAAELVSFLASAENDPQIRVVILRGKGDYFCAGGDLKWMSQGAELAPDNRSGKVLAELYSALYRFPKPLITLVHGAAMGGALGLVACADFVLAENQAVFSFSEVKLGLVPATISPFVIKRIGELNARQLMLSGEKINATEAVRVHLADKAGNLEEIEKFATEIAAGLAHNAPEAMKVCKSLIQQVANKEIDSQLIKYTSDLLTSLQQSEEAQEGMKAFLEKRNPVWQEKKNK